jgi:hypothetical protein
MEEDKIDSNDFNLTDFVEMDIKLPVEVKHKLRAQLGREVETGDFSDLVQQLLQKYLKS